MQLYLNYNYGKVVVSDMDINDKAVAIDGEQGLEHVLFKGFINEFGLRSLRVQFDKETIEETTFFGSSGFRVSENDSWTFCENGQKLVAIRVKKSVFCLQDNNGHPIQRTEKPQVAKAKPNNVFNIGGAK